MLEAPALAPADDAVLASLHPDCPDWERLGPDSASAAVRAAAEAQRVAESDRTSTWAKGLNRRTFLQGGLGLGVAVLGAQTVTTRVSYAAAAEQQAAGTLVVIFLRGGLDGLSLLTPTFAADQDYLAANRGDVAIRSTSTGLVSLDTGWGLHPAMAPLQSLIDQGKVAAIPAVSTPDLTRSHFQAQDCLERGSSGSLQTGWLDRVLDQSGAGTTFRSVAVGGLLPRSLMGTSGSISMQSIAALDLSVAADRMTATKAALEQLYTGLDHPITTQSMLALEALATAASVRADMKAAPSSVTYPAGNFGTALASVAGIIKSGVGARVATMDVGGWDMHTMMGTPDDGQARQHLGDLAAALAAFARDLGPALDTTTVVTMSEFGRRVQTNASKGTDHGHGGVVLALGGGVKGGVHGKWTTLSDASLDHGDVPGLNDYRDVLGEVVGGRLNLSAGQLATVFPNWSLTKLGVMA